jgi:transporter family protein
MWIFLAFLSAFFAGATAVLAKAGLRNVDSDLATALRTLVVAVFSWVLVFITGAKWSAGENSLSSLLFLLLSGLATGASWLCYFRALQLGQVGQVMPVDKSSTILSILFAVVLLGETDNLPVKAAGVCLIALGTFLMISQKRPLSPDTQTQGRGWFFFAALSAIFAALTSILGKIGIEGVDANLGTAIRTMVVLVMAWLIVLQQRKQQAIFSITRKDWIFITLSGMTTGMSWLCYYQALQKGEASIVAPIDKLSALFTALFAFLFLKEKMDRKKVIGLLVLTAGTLILLIKI